MRTGDDIATVMLVQKEAEEDSTVRHALEDRGYNLVVTRKERAVKDAIEEQPDILFIDLELPLGYSVMAARFITSAANCPGVPVVLVTADKKKDGPKLHSNEFVIPGLNAQHMPDLVNYLVSTKPLFVNFAGA
jgi:CheY-like chemotaxis protein